MSKSCFPRYALSIFENANLARLWNTTANKSDNLRILHGTVQFQNNPQLCYKTVMNLLDSISIAQNATALDVSTYSNGHKAICEYTAEKHEALKTGYVLGEEIKLNLRVVYNQQGVMVLAWDAFNTTAIDHRMFLGYMLYNREVENPGQVSIYENRDVCFDRFCVFGCILGLIFNSGFLQLAHDVP